MSIHKNLLKFSLLLLIMLNLIITEKITLSDSSLTAGTLDFYAGGDYFGALDINYIFPVTNKELSVDIEGKICYVVNKNALDLCLKLSKYITNQWVNHFNILNI